MPVVMEACADGDDEDLHSTVPADEIRLLAAQAALRPRCFGSPARGRCTSSRRGPYSPGGGEGQDGAGEDEDPPPRPSQSSSVMRRARIQTLMDAAVIEELNHGPPGHAPYESDGGHLDHDHGWRHDDGCEPTEPAGEEE